MTMENLELFIPLLVAALSFAAKVISDINESRHRINELKENKIQDRRSAIIKKLNDFYGPFQQNLNKSTSLYRALLMDKPKDFRMLKFLLAAGEEYPNLKLSKNDETLIQQIIAIGKKQQKLIDENAGLINDPILSYDYEHSSDDEFDTNREDLKHLGLLGWTNAHYEILQLAHEGKLKGDLEKFQHYVFPRELRANIIRRIKELTDELNDLRELSTKNI